MENKPKTHEEIPGLVFVSNISMKPALSDRRSYDFLATEQDAIKQVRGDKFNEIPIEDFHAIRNPYQAFNWSVYVDKKYEENIKAWHQNIFDMLEMMRTILAPDEKPLKMEDFS